LVTRGRFWVSRISGRYLMRAALRSKQMIPGSVCRVWGDDDR